MQLRFVCLVLFTAFALLLWYPLPRAELMRVSPLSRAFDRYVDALGRTPRFAAFADECRRIQLIETNDGGALTTSNFGVIQMCTKHIHREHNEIVYVLVHELTHVFLKSDMHDGTFDRAFAELLDVAVKDGLYARKTYTKTTPGVFCGKEFY
jgi:hypothetical protein